MGDDLGGRYRLEAQIGGGGAASVWRAMDVRLGRHVAVKLLHRNAIPDGRAEERFAREAEIVARFDHPNIVRLFDRGEDAHGSAYLVFELVEGEDLRQRLDRVGTLSPDDAAATCAAVADALAYAHARGVVHRDVKARNVLVTGDGEVKLTDFGVATLLEADAASGLTQTGMLIGTADYLSPEQATGQPVDARTDVYSLGVLLFESLTGRVPFTGESVVAVAVQQTSVPVPDVREKAPGTPPWLAAVVERACQKDPDERFGGATAMATALRAGISAPQGNDVTATMPQVVAAPGRRGRVVASVLAVAALTAGGAVLLTRNDAKRQPIGNDVNLPVVQVATVDSTNDGERDAEAPLAIDGKPGTAWRTERYFDRDPMTYKKALGLRLTLGAAAQAHRISITASPGSQIEVLSPGPGGISQRSALIDATGARQDVALKQAPAAVTYTLNFVKVPAEPNNPTRFIASISEVRLAGTAN